MIHQSDEGCRHVPPSVSAAAQREPIPIALSRPSPTTRKIRLSIARPLAVAGTTSSWCSACLARASTLREENAIEVVSSVYEAALQPPNAWTKPIELLRRTFGACSGKLASIDFEAGVGRTVAMAGIDPVLDGRWRTEFAAREPWSTAARALLLAGHRGRVASAD